MTTLVVLEAIVLVLLCVLVAGLLRSHATILRKLHELGAGVEDSPTPTQRGRVQAPPRRPSIPAPGGRPASAPAHDVVGVSLDEEAVAVRVVGAPGDTLLVFLSSGCTTCGAFWEALGDPGLATPSGARVVVIVQDAEEEHPALLQELAPPGVQELHTTSAWQDYEVPGSPYVILADGETGRLRGEGTAQTLEQVLSMLGRAGDDAAHRARLDARRGDKASADAAREATVDEELLAAGVTPGDPSLYQPADEGAGR
jgi:hypothetical protein